MPLNVPPSIEIFPAMTRLLLLFAIFACATATPKDKRLRNLWNLERVSECVLGWSAINYNGYGCWCGVGGSGEPVDGIDACCRDHDKCYDAAIDTKVCFDVPIEYIDPYNWDCNNHTATCTDPENPVNCGRTLCECDRAVVNCWKQFTKPPSKVKCNHADRYFAWFDALKAGIAKKVGFYH